MGTLTTETAASLQASRIIEEVTRDVFSTMMGAEITVGEPREVQLDSPLSNGVVALVGISGTWTGTGRLYCTSKAACYFASRFLQIDYADVDRQVLDVIAEMANMITGNLKTTLESKVGPLSLSLPTVIYGQNYITHCTAARVWTVLPICCGDQAMDVGFFLVPSPALLPAQVV